MKNFNELVREKQNQGERVWKQAWADFKTECGAFAQTLFDAFQTQLLAEPRHDSLKQIPYFYILVLIGGSSPWQYLNRFFHGTTIIPNTDTDAYVFGKNPNEQLLLDANQTIIGNALLDQLKGTDRKTGPGYFQGKVAGNDLGIIQKWEALNNFNFLIDPRTGEIYYDPEIPTHAEDLKRFIFEGIIISYRLEKYRDEAIRYWSSPAYLAATDKKIADAKNNGVNKLAYLLKSYLKPLSIGKTFSLETAHFLHDLLTNELYKDLMVKITERMSAHYETALPKDVIQYLKNIENKCQLIIDRNTDYKSLYEKSQKEKKELELQLSTQNNSISIANQQIRSLNAQNLSAYNELTNTNNLNKQKITELESQNKDKDNQIIELKNKATVQLNNQNNMNEKVKALEKTLSEERIKNDSSVKTIESMKSDLFNKSKEVDSLKKEKEKLTKGLVDLTLSHDALTQLKISEQKKMALALKEVEDKMKTMSMEVDTLRDKFSQKSVNSDDVANMGSPDNTDSRVNSSDSTISPANETKCNSKDENENEDDEENNNAFNVQSKKRKKKKQINVESNSAEVPSYVYMYKELTKTLLDICFEMNGEKIDQNKIKIDDQKAYQIFGKIEPAKKDAYLAYFNSILKGYGNIVNNKINKKLDLIDALTFVFGTNVDGFKGNDGFLCVLYMNKYYEYHDVIFDLLQSENVKEMFGTAKLKNIHSNLSNILFEVRDKQKKIKKDVVEALIQVKCIWTFLDSFRKDISMAATLSEESLNEMSQVLFEYCDYYRKTVIANKDIPMNLQLLSKRLFIQNQSKDYPVSDADLLKFEQAALKAISTVTVNETDRHDEENNDALQSKTREDNYFAWQAAMDYSLYRCNDKNWVDFVKMFRELRRSCCQGFSHKKLIDFYFDAIDVMKTARPDLSCQITQDHVVYTGLTVLFKNSQIDKINKDMEVEFTALMVEATAMELPAGLRALFNLDNNHPVYETELLMYLLERYSSQTCLGQVRKESVSLCISKLKIYLEYLNSHSKSMNTEQKNSSDEQKSSSTSALPFYQSLGPKHYQLIQYKNSTKGVSNNNNSNNTISTNTQQAINENGGGSNTNNSDKNIQKNKNSKKN